jgi:Pentapeptide repeats (8 copies)
MIRLKSLAGSIWQLLLTLGFLSLMLTCVLVLPKHLVNRSLSPTSAQPLLPVERLKAENDIRTTLLQSMGALVLLVGAIATWRQLYLSQQQLYISREGQITERFTRSIEQMGNTNIDIQLGGIYALERIANESVNDREPITEILTAFVRTHSPQPPKDEAPDTNLMPLQARAPAVQAAMTVLGRRKTDHVMEIVIPTKLTLNPVTQDMKASYPTVVTLELVNVDLRKANLANADLVAANLANANLEKANLYSAHLQCANLSGAVLRGADFDGTDFEGAILCGAHLEGADLCRALHLEKANLRSAWADSQTRWPDDFHWKAAGIKISSYKSPGKEVGDKLLVQSSGSDPD